MAFEFELPNPNTQNPEGRPQRGRPGSPLGLLGAGAGAPAYAVAKLIDVSKVSAARRARSGMSGVERQARRSRHQCRLLRQSADLTPNMFTLMRFTEWVNPETKISNG